MNKLIWIDEGTLAMKKVIDRLFPQLWEKNVKSLVYMLNDAEDIASELNTAVYNNFVQFLIDNKSIYDTEKCHEFDDFTLTCKDNPNICSDVVKTHISTGDIEPSVDDILDKVYSDSTWCSQSGTIAESAGLSSPETWFAINLCLRNSDFDALTRHEIGKPASSQEKLLSMCLYNRLRASNKKVLLYTTYDISEVLASAWADIYKSLFGAKDKPIICNRIGGAGYMDSYISDNLVDIISRGI